MDIIKKAILEGEHKMKQAIEATGQDFATIRTGRASPALVEEIKVEYYGNQMPLNQVSRISAPEPRLLVVAPWDKSLVPQIQKALTSSSLGVNPTADGNVVRVPIPPLTEERRKELAKLVGAKAEEGKVAIRNIRREVMEQLKKMEKSHKISEDDLHRAQDEVQESTDKYSEQLDQLHDAKIEEVMEV